MKPIKNWGALALLAFLPALAVAQGAPAGVAAPASTPAPQSTPEPKTADEAYKAGMAAYEAGDYVTAFLHFEKAADLTSDPQEKSTFTFNKCRCLQETEQWERALTCFQNFISAAPPTETSIGRAQGYIAKIEKRMKGTSSPASTPPVPSCQLILSNIPKGVVVKLNRQVVADPSQPISTDCVEQVVQVERDGTQIAGGRVAPTTPDKPARWEFVENVPPIVDEKALAAAAASKAEAETETTAREWWGYGLIAGGGVALVTSGVFGYLMQDSIATQEERQGNRDYTRAELNAANDEATGRQTGMIVAGAAGLALIGGGLYLILSGDESPTTAPAQPTTFRFTGDGFAVSW